MAHGSRLGPDILTVFGGMFPPGYTWKPVLILQAGFDGSTSGQPPILTVAGFLGRLAAVARFEREWRKVRQEFGLRHFRMSSFMSLCPPVPYKNWDTDQRREVVSRLICLINETFYLGVGVALNLHEYRAEVSATPVYKPYRMCAGLCIGSVARRLSEKPGESVRYIFEAGDDGVGAFREAMARIVRSSQKYRDEMRIHGITPGSKEQYPSLDAADFLAWLVGQDVPRMAPGGFATRRSYAQRIRVPVMAYVVPRDHLREFASARTDEKRQQLAARYGLRLKVPKPPKPRR